jgi:hypothetical protein
MAMRKKKLLAVVFILVLSASVVGLASANMIPPPIPGSQLQTQLFHAFHH